MVVRNCHVFGIGARFTELARADSPNVHRQVIHQPERDGRVTLTKLLIYFLRVARLENYPKTLRVS